MDQRTENYLLLAFYTMIFLIGLPANLLALRAFICRVRQPHPAPIHILLLSLTLANLLLLLLLPLKMVEAANNSRWLLGKATCALTGFGFYSSIYCSTWLLAAISIERYLGVAFPVQYKISRRPIYGLAAALVAWILSFGHCSMVIVVEYLEPRNKTSENQTDFECYNDFNPRQLYTVLSFRLEVCLVLFCLPMAVTVFCYWRFVCLMMGQPQVGAKRQQRAVGLAVVTLLNFLLCFAPYNVSHVIGFYEGKTPSWRKYAVLFSALNAGLDPLLFYFSSSAVRRALGDGLKALQNQGSSLLGHCGRGTEGDTGDTGLSQGDGVASSDFTTE
ncbi:LOW QUALITY PROTEIN: free fatty acid receptor 2 [Phascolarctos cinereus]|uniref:Free fatty acid receptor 1 n=1 Tax=Phascolarctos cinereus TaxID=38626 RepID=A0A6P5JFP7_PHACI|nr:LOW QUALITY PROTEIN: free fatty acid receptor 2 [Phascolarctos cinereus]